MSKAMQLKDKIKNLALKNYVPAQTVLGNSCRNDHWKESRSPNSSRRSF